MKLENILDLEFQIQDYLWRMKKNERQGLTDLQADRVKIYEIALTKIIEMKKEANIMESEMPQTKRSHS